MDLNSITVNDFKALFRRDFPYLPVWNAETLYNAGGVTYDPTTQLFYVSIGNGNIGNLPTDNTKWTVQAPQSDVDDYVQDSDIQRAFAEAQILFNQALWGTDPQITMGYLYLTAAYLVNDLRTAMGGVGSVGFFPTSSRSVGNVSESFEIPDAFKTNPSLTFLAQSGYGMKYISLLLPNLVGNVGVVAGWSQP